MKNSDFLKYLHLVVDMKINKYSQLGEELILLKIFENIGTTNKYLVDFGAGDGEILSNSNLLIEEHGFNGLLMDVDNKDNQKVKKEIITAENICALFKKHNVPKTFDLLCIDIDGNDYYVLKAIIRGGYRPRVILTKFNDCIPNGVDKYINYNANHVYDNTDYYGYSYTTGLRLAKELDYVVVCENGKTNLVMIDKNENLDWSKIELPVFSHQQYHKHKPDGEWIIHQRQALNNDKKFLSLEPVKSDSGSLSLSFLERIVYLFHADVFVETGTNFGATTAEAAKVFREVHTIELGHELFQKATKRFENNDNIHVYHGDSSVVLKDLLPHIQGKTVFWLDGHYSGGETARGNENTPIMKEIQLIRQHNIKDAIILIDDIRIFCKNPNPASIVYGYPTLRELFSAILTIDHTYCFEIIGDVAIAYPSNDGIQVSSVIRGCTISRFYDENPELGYSILEAEQNISYATGLEQKAISQLCNQFGLSNFEDQSRYYALWSGLILYHNKKYVAAIQLFTMLLSRGFNHWRIQWYLARAAYESGNLPIAQTSLFVVLNTQPDFQDAHELMDKIKIDTARWNTITTSEASHQKKILFYCGINNLVNFSRIRPYYDLCYGFDANPEKVEYAKKIYHNDPGVKIIYGALTEKSGEEIEFTITTNWDPASSLGSPNPEYRPNAKNPDMLAAQTIIKVPTISLYDFCIKNNISQIDTLLTDLQGIDFTVLKTLIIFIQACKIREIQCEVEPDNTPTRYLGIPPGKLKDFNKLLSENYDVLWMDPPGPPQGAWEMDVRWRVKNTAPDDHVDFVVENELLVPLVKSFLINFVNGHQQKEITINHKGNVSVIWSANPIDGCDVYVYHNSFSYQGKRGGVDFLMMLEPAVVLPGEFDDQVWKHFDHVFGLFDALPARGTRFHKIFFPRADLAGVNPITEAQSLRESRYPLSGRKKAICMIGSNRSSHVPYELYSKRIEVARWFAEHSKMPFDVYGTPFALPNYRGPCPVSQKLSMLKQYRYNLCFENTNDPVLSAGYVTEKILDCLETRTIPIYLGASNIEQYIPPECFIDLRNFADYQALDTYIRSVSEAKYQSYINHIDKFVCSGGLRMFSETALYHQIIQTLIDEKSLDARYYENDIFWQSGPSSAVRKNEWSSTITPAMWTWKHLSKANPPLLENGKIVDQRPSDQHLTEANAKHTAKSFLIGKKPSIKVLVAGSKFSSGNARRGYDYVWWNIFDALNHFENIETNFFDYATEAQQRGVAGMSESLEEIVRKENPDLIFYSPADRNAGILRESLTSIADHTDTRTVIWMNNHQGHVKEETNLWASCANYIITLSPESAGYFAAAGFGSKVIESQWGFNPYTYNTSCFRLREISFCGTAKGNRSEILEQIKQNGLSVDVFGSGWHEDSFIPFYDMVRIFVQSRINLNLSGTSELTTNQINRRTFEVPGSRGFLLTMPADHLEDYYESGKEVVVASSLEELIDKAKHYLAHEREREKVAQRGHERTIAEHTWSNRFIDIFKHIGFTAIPQKLPTISGTSHFKQSSPQSMPVSVKHSDPENSAEKPVDCDYENIETSIFMMAYNKLQYTKQCVESILHYTKGNYELLLTDNGSTDGTYEYFEWVKSFHPRTRVIKNFANRIAESLGNHGYSLARGKYVAGIANDAVVHEGWVNNFIAQIESAPDIGIVGSRSNSISGPQVAQVDYNTLEAYHAFAAEWCKQYKGSNFAIQRVVPMAAIFKKTILERIGFLDPDLPTNGRDGGYGFSDDDLTLRLRMGGYRSLVANDVFIHHYGSVTAKQDRPDLFGAPQNINKEKYIRKIRNNNRIIIGADGQMTIKPYSLHDVIPIDERTAIRTPRICFVETNDTISKKTDAESLYAAVARKYNGENIQSQSESIQSLILKILDDKQYDFLVLIDSRLAPPPEIISALAESSLCYPDVAVMVPVGNYAPATHTHKTDLAQEVEIIPYADLSLCSINLKIVRPLLPGLARCENDNELIWFMQRRIRGESYYIAKANNIEVNCSVPIIAHPYDTQTLPEKLIKEKKYTEAIAVYQSDLLKDPNFAEAYYHLACIAREQRQKEEAIKRAQQALAVDPHHIESLIFLSRLFMDQNKWEKAESFIRQANLKQSGHPDVLQIVAQYEKVVKENPGLLQTEESHIIPDLTNPEYVKGRTSIIIAASSNHARECLAAIKKHTPEPYELIVIDALATADLKKKLKKSVKEHSPYKILEHQTKKSLLQSINQGINSSTGEYIVLLSNDTLVSEDWLTGMLTCLNYAPAAGVIAPMTNKGTGPQHVTDESYQSVNHLDKFAAEFKERFHHRRIPCRNIARFCMLFKRTLAEKIGLFDERFDTRQFEDEDFCWRSALAGYQNYIAGDVFIHHHRSKEPQGDRTILDKKWTLSLDSSEGKKLAVIKAMEFADILYSRGETDRAVEALVNCITFTPDTKEIYYELSRIFIESKKFSETLEVVGTMPEAAKNDLKGLECAGYAKEGLGLDDEAAAYADKMLSQNEKYPAALNLKGVLAYKKDDKEKAVEYFRKAIDADPGYGDAYTNLGVLYWGMDKKDEALAHLHKGFVLSPTTPDNSSIYYSVLSSSGLHGEAEADFREACRSYPRHKILAFLYIDILISQGKFDIAMLRIEDTIALFGLDEGILNAALSVREKIGPLQIDKSSNKGTLSICMIVKNEEKFLVKCLRSIRDVVDEIIIVDTGSTDKTTDIAKAFGAKLFDFPWTGDFSAARNHSLAQATGDWIFILDADEVISSLDFDELKTIVHKRPSTAVTYNILTRNYIDQESIIGWTPNDGKYPDESHNGWMPSAKVRLFTRRKDIFFTNPVHELLETSVRKAKIPILPGNVVVHHYGKLDVARDTQKGEDYYLLGKIKYENDPTNVKYIHELAKQAQVLHKNEEAMELWLKLLSLIDADHQSPAYQEIARISYGDPISETYTLLAGSYMALNRYDEALASARKAMETEVKRKEYVNVYAECEIIAGSMEKAFSALEEQLKIMPDYSIALILMAVISCLKGEKERTQDLFQLLQQKHTEITFHLNIIARRLNNYGKKDEALLILNAMIENKISNQETMRLVGVIQNSRSSA